MKAIKRRAGRLCRIGQLRGSKALLLCVSAAGSGALSVGLLWAYGILTRRLAVCCGLLLLPLLLLVRVEAAALALSRATGVRCSQKAKRRAFGSAWLLLFLCVGLLCVALLPTGLLGGLWAWSTHNDTAAPASIPLALCCILSFVLSVGFFVRWRRLLGAVDVLTLSGVPFCTALRLSGRTMTARRRAFAALRRSLCGWQLFCLCLLPLPFVWFFALQCRVLLLLEPDFRRRKA